MTIWTKRMITHTDQLAVAASVTAPNTRVEMSANSDSSATIITAR